MSVRQVQREVDSYEFAEWMAFYKVEAEGMKSDEAPPTKEQLGDKLRAWAEGQNAKVKR